MSDDRWTQVDELQLGRMTTGLTDDDRLDLDARLDADPEAAWLEELVGEIDAELAREDEVPLPAGLREKLLADAPTVKPSPRLEANASHEAVPDSQVVPIREVRPSSNGLPAWSGWVAAAAVVVLWLMPGNSVPSEGPTTVVEAPVDPMAELLAVADLPDAVQIDWTATEDPTAASVSGEVVWSDEAGRGYMRFAGLESNDPNDFQYQLWIFDADRDDRYPVDGGVFDIPAGESEIIVPIDAQLPVSQAALFAVTVEQPGGVVVSDRSRITVLAQAE